MPLSGAGLWTRTPSHRNQTHPLRTRKAFAGVGTTPASQTSIPELASPADTAELRNSPETLGSLAMTALGRSALSFELVRVTALGEHQGRALA